MKIISCQSPIEAAEAAEELLRQTAEAVSKPLRIFLPTGRTPRNLYHLMVGEKSFWSQNLKAIQIDEFVDPKRIFYTELKFYLLAPLSIEPLGQYILPQWSDGEMEAHIQKVMDEPIDVALLGIGPNGHVGFHEPRLVTSVAGRPSILDGPEAEKFKGGRVIVSDETRHRVPAAITNEVLTFGAASFLKARQIILMVTGPEKKSIYEKFLEANPTPEIPATLLKDHGDLTVVTDC